jgi:myo-inositol-1(or 4)-monophosphatase
MIKTTEIKTYRKFAVVLAKKAGEYVYKNFGKVKKIEKKGFRDYVTNVDKTAEEIIISAIRKKFPTHGILSEEKGNLGNKSDYLWIIDPLDGTYNYAAEIPVYGISIALYLDGKALIGVNYLPHLKELYEAGMGQGAFLNGKRIRVSDIRFLDKSFILPESGYKMDRIREKAENYMNLLEKSEKVRILGSFVFQFSLVAAGRVDGVTGETGRPWDYAASVLIIKEAGGRVTNFKGEEFKIIKDSKILATNGKIHNQLLKLLNLK